MTFAACVRPVALTVCATACIAAVASRSGDRVPPRTLALVWPDPVARAGETTANALSQMDNSCGTPLGYARAELMLLGEAATAALAPVLDDRDHETAVFAAELLVDTGEARKVFQWCAAHDLRRDPRGRDLCERALLRLAGVAALPVEGVWRGDSYRVGYRRQGATPLELRVRVTERGLGAEVCIGPGDCSDAELIRQIGGRLVVRYRHRGVPTVLNLGLIDWVLEPEPVAIGGWSTPAGCDDLDSHWLCRRYVELRRQPTPR